jgi:hypothetical protein
MRETVTVKLPPPNIHFNQIDTVHYVYFTSYNTHCSSKMSTEKRKAPNHSNHLNSIEANLTCKEDTEMSPPNTPTIYQTHDFYFRASEFHQFKIRVDIYSQPPSECKDFEFKETTNNSFYLFHSLSLSLSLSKHTLIHFHSLIHNLSLFIFYLFYLFRLITF